jgi:hypothetical protein
MNKSIVINSLQAIIKGLEAEDDPYKALKEAHARGGVIQYYHKGNTNWVTTDNPKWNSLLYDYRIRPTPRLVPLEAGDVVPLSCIKREEWRDGVWAMVTAVEMLGIEYVNADTIERLPFDLLADGWLIKRPGEDWKPCSKPAPDA